MGCNSLQPCANADKLAFKTILMPQRCRVSFGSCAAGLFACLACCTFCVTFEGQLVNSPPCPACRPFCSPSLFIVWTQRCQQQHSSDILVVGVQSILAAYIDVSSWQARMPWTAGWLAAVVAGGCVLIFFVVARSSWCLSLFLQGVW